MKLSQMMQGKKAESEPVEVVGFGFTVLCVPLTATEYGNACVFARERAKAKGAENPENGDPVYDLALMAAVLVAGCVDPDSPPDARAKSFESVDEILDAMHPEHVVYLHEHHERWQDETSPNHRKLSGEALFDKVREVTGADGLAGFMRLSPSTRWHFVRSMGLTLLGLLEVKSTPSSPSSGSSPTRAPSTPKKRSGSRAKSRRSATR